MIGNAIQIIQWLYNQDKDKRFDIKEHKEKRSLNANNYAWKLITEIGDALRRSKEEIYLEMLKSYGQCEMISIVSSVDVKGYFKYYEEAGRSFLNGKEFTHYKIYKGSSEFDTKEMSIFIDGIVQEATQLGIETRTPSELALLKSEWNTQSIK